MTNLREAVLELVSSSEYQPVKPAVIAKKLGLAEDAARELATAFGASIKVTEGSGLLSDNFPMIHAVGRAITNAPCNGWEHWYYEDEASGQLRPLDELRQRLRTGG